MIERYRRNPTRLQRRPFSEENGKYSFRARFWLSNNRLVPMFWLLVMNEILSNLFLEALCFERFSR